MGSEKGWVWPWLPRAQWDPLGLWTLLQKQVYALGRVWLPVLLLPMAVHTKLPFPAMGFCQLAWQILSPGLPAEPLHFTHGLLFLWQL